MKAARTALIPARLKLWPNQAWNQEQRDSRDWRALDSHRLNPGGVRARVRCVCTTQLRILYKSFYKSLITEGLVGVEEVEWIFISNKQKLKRLKNPGKKVNDTIKTKSNDADTGCALTSLTTLDKNLRSQQQTNIKASPPTKQQSYRPLSSFMSVDAPDF